MWVQAQIIVSVNSKQRQESHSVDLRYSTSINSFKHHLLGLLKLSGTQSDRYLLSMHTHDYMLSDDPAQKFESFLPLMNDLDLKQVVISTLKQDKPMLFKLEKFVLENSNKNSVRSKKRRLQKNSTKPMNVIEFDSKGEVVRDRLQVLQQRPAYKIYPVSNDEEVCAFCRESSKEEELRVKVGPVYGPIRSKGQQVFVHELCALWTPEIYLDDNNKLKNLTNAIKRCNKMKCSLCKEKGGGLGCFVKNCDKSYHFLCAKLSDCLFVNSKFIIFCGEHKAEAPPEYQEEEQEDEDGEDLQHYICSICKSGLDEDTILICDKCDQGFHANCHKPQVEIALLEEEEEWFCGQCLQGQI